MLSQDRMKHEVLLAWTQAVPWYKTHKSPYGVKFATTYIQDKTVLSAGPESQIKSPDLRV